MSSPLTGHFNTGRTFPLIISGTTVLEPNTNNRVVARLTGGATLTLPALSTTPNGFELLIRNNSVAPQTLAVQASGADLIVSGSSSSTTVNVLQDEMLHIICDHETEVWQIFFGPA